MLNKTILAATAATALLAAGAASAQTVWRFSNWIPPTHPVNIRIQEAFGKDIERVTEGRVKVQVIPALGPPTAHFDLVRNGVADMALVVPAYTPQRFQLTRVAEFPFISTSSAASSLAAYRAHAQHFAKVNEFAGVKLASVWTHGPAHLFTVSKPITSMADLKGMKIRTAGGTSDEAVQLAGATTFFAPASATYDVLSKGVADGIAFPHESVPGFRLETILRHALVFPTGLYQTTHSITINQAKFDALSAKDKAAVEALLGEPLTVKAAAVWDDLNNAGVETMKKAGITFKDAPESMVNELRGRYAGMLEEWYGMAAKKNVDGPAAYALVRKTVDEVEAKMKKGS
jgi:TRAP-type C4-dicarboxylate transport system substrate-binding protein